MARLIALAGLPGSGKSTLARALAEASGAVWLRIDSMDAAIWRSGTAPRDLEDWTYRAAQAVAVDNLRLGRDVIADCVNDWTIAREGWRSAGAEAGARLVWLEIVCSDPVEHRRRIEGRPHELAGLTPPTWPQVEAREYHPWSWPRYTLDTAGRSVAACVDEALREAARR